MDLTGTWRAAVADDDLRRTWHDDEFDDSSWESIEVPGHWRSTPAFADSDGPLLYRRQLEAPAPTDGRRSWLTLDGLFYQGDVWLDGAYLGDTEGYFAPHRSEEHTSELQSLMRISYAVFCLKKTNKHNNTPQ